jgi:hypothetical protein
MRRRGRDVLGLRRAPIGPSEHLVTWREAGDARTNGIDATREIRALSERKLHRKHILKQTFANRNLAWICACRNNTHDDLTFRRLGFRDLDDPELLDSAVGGELNGSWHTVWPFLRRSLDSGDAASPATD